jgi:medium-chain acyl-[acyl-carrier-protein] hydrolase
MNQGILRGGTRVTLTKESVGWVLRLRREGPPRLRLFCFPYAGGAAAVYRSWPDGLPRDIEVCAVRLPGREARFSERPFERARDLVAGAADALTPLFDVPFAFFGHSMGALLAFELARELRRRRGRQPVRLVVSGARAPQRPNPDPPVRHLPDREFLEEVRLRYDGIPGAVLANQELVELLMPCLRADFTLVETYAYADEAPLDCPISCFGGKGDPRVSADDLQAWGAQTASRFALRMFEGDHFFLQSAEGAVRRAVGEELGVA